MVTNENIEAAQLEIDELLNVHRLLGLTIDSETIRPGRLATVFAIKGALSESNDYLFEDLQSDYDRKRCPVEAATDLQTFVGFAIDQLKEKKALEVGLQVLRDEERDDARELAKLRTFTFSFTLELDPTCADDKCFNGLNAIEEARHNAGVTALSLGCGDKAAAAAAMTARVTLTSA